MPFAFDPPPVPTVAVVGPGDLRFPLRRVLCVGRNYAAHAREMGGDADRERPFFFTKPADAVFDAGPEAKAAMPYPPLTSDLHHEVELAVAVSRGGRGISPADALDHVFGYAVALDLTRRDLQREAKAAGRPWDGAKAFDMSAPVAPIHPVAAVGHPSSGRIWLDVDGERRQDGDLSELIWTVPEVLAQASQGIALAPGDLILTGTPAGVGPLVPGQEVRAGIEGLGELLLRIADAGSATRADL